MRNRITLILLLIILPVVLSGCFNLAEYDQKIIDKNQELSDKAKEKVDEGVEIGKEKIKEYTKEQIDKIVSDLTDNMKQSIDDWIDQSDLNEFGDTKDTVYTGGTPLFDEVTGDLKDKYEYILENNPDLIEDLGLE